MRSKVHYVGIHSTMLQVDPLIKLILKIINGKVY